MDRDQHGLNMPNISHDIKLDFKDVLLRPKRSQIRSRADVSNEGSDYRTYKLLNHSSYGLLRKDSGIISFFCVNAPGCQE